MKVYGNIDLRNNNKIINSSQPSGSTDSDLVTVQYYRENMNSGTTGDFIPLDGSTGITGSLIPSLPGLTLGSPENPWGEIYVTGSTIYIDNIPIRSTNNTIVMDNLTINNGYIGGVNISYDDNQLISKKVDAIYNKLKFPNIHSGGTLTERDWKYIAANGDILVSITSDGDVIHSFDGGYNWSEDKVLVNTWRGVQHETEGSSVYTQVPINVSAVGVVTKIEVLNFSLSDYWIGDIDCKLVSPSGREVVLFGGIGGGSKYITNANFSDDASSAISSGTPPYTGIFKPIGNLSDFIGDSVEGDWKIYFRDPAYDGGVEYNYQGLTSWDIKIYYNPNIDLSEDQKIYKNIVYGNDIFIAIGSSGKTMYSSNSGLSWNENIISINDTLLDFTDIVYGNDIFVATLSNIIVSGDTSGCIATSNNGIDWIIRETNINNGLYAISYSDNQFNAISNNYFMSSIDGINWTEPENILFDGADKIASGKNIIVVISSTGNTLAISKDMGLSFEILNSDNYIHGNICFGDNRFIICSNDSISGYRILDSIDGKNYSSLGVIDKSYEDIIYNGEKFISITNESYSLIIPDMVPNRIVDLENEIEDRFKNEYRVKSSSIVNLSGYANNTISKDWGWIQKISTFTETIISYDIIGDTIFVSSKYNVWKSIDGGLTFNQLSVTLPNNSYIMNMKFINVNFGIIIGSKYTTLKTIDGGENWTVITSSTSGSDLFILSVVNENHWVTIGDGYAGYTTLDGGTTIEYTNGVFQYPWSLSMVNSGIGYAGYALGRIYKTVNGGRNWSLISTLPNSNESTSQYWIDENIGYAGTRTTGKVCKTLDGGFTWNAYDVNFQTGERVVHLIFSGDTGYAFGMNGSISKTIDGGITWIYQNSIQGGNIVSAYCRPNLIDINNVEIFQKGINRLLKTTTGGYDIKTDLDNTYPSVNDKILVKNQINKKENGVYIVKSSQPLLLERCDELYDGKFLFVSEGTKNAGYGFIQTTNDNIVLGTSDIVFKQFATNCVDIENKSYTVLYTNTNSFITNISCYNKDNDNILLYNDTLTEIANDNFGVYFLNETTGFSYYLGNIKKTIDGGETWTTVLDTTGINLFHMQFVNESVGYIVSHSVGRVYKTINGGDNWTLCTSPPSVGTLYCLKFLDENIGFVAGSSRIYKTVDGGLNWTTVNTFSNNIWAIDFVDSNIGFAAGDNNMLFKTTNGGNTWTSHINIMTTAATRGMQFIGNVGYICKSDGNIYKTIDSGENWVLKTSTTKNVLLHIQFLNENFGYCVGENDTFYKTIDGGDTWIQRKDDFPGHPLRISIVNENLTYISSYSQNRIYRMVSDDSIERNFGIENIEINDIVLLNKSFSNINGIFYVNEKNDVFVGLERLCVLNTNDLCNISKGYMSGNTYVYTGNNNYAHYKSDELINISGHTNDTSIHFTKNSINLSDLGNSAHTHSNTLIDINGVTGITLTLPKSYSIVEVIDENGYVISCDKHYNNDGTTIDLVFISTFTGKAICN